jgi:hypothetical protein
MVDNVDNQCQYVAQSAGKNQKLVLVPSDAAPTYAEEVDRPGAAQVPMRPSCA